MFGAAPGWKDLVFWALDLETGGLSPKRDAILAVGMVPIRDGTIRVGEAFSTLVRPNGNESSSNDSIAAHHILPSESRDAPGLEEAYSEVTRRLENDVLLAHHAALDVAFLKQAARRLGTAWPAPPVVDTVKLLQRYASRQRFLGAGSREPVLNLAEARQEFALPPYPVHDALSDAIAAAELFLVLRRRLGARTLAALV